jgi:ABC-type multidrug transport system fused ATPase/permease subunit
MRLNGWQRLWILNSIIFLFMAGGYIFSSLVEPTDIYHSDSFYSSMSEKNYSMLVFAKIESRKKPQIEAKLNEAKKRGIIVEAEMANGHTLIFKKKDTEEDIAIAAKDYWKVIESISKNRNSELIKNSVLFYLATISVIYIFGWLIAWVIRGFKPQVTNL